jgi:hypothetical protein
VACISHPDGARKKITFGYLITHPFGDPANYWGVIWTSGTIEQGSSGSGLYPDATQLLMGVASHSAVPTDCDHPEGPSGYGKFGRFYTFGTVDELLEEGTDDPLEDFDTCETALPVATFPVTLPGLIVKSTDEDWYRVNIPTGGEFTADATFVQFNGDIDLELYGECGGDILASANSSTSDEHLSYYNASAAADFYLRVFLDKDTRQEYDVSLDLNYVECPGDLDGDGDTDQGDLGILLADWGCTGGGCAGDLDNDGDTDQGDLGILLADWGCGTEP